MSKFSLEVPGLDLGALGGAIEVAEPTSAEVDAVVRELTAGLEPTKPSRAAAPPPPARASPSVRAQAAAPAPAPAKLEGGAMEQRLRAYQRAAVEANRAGDLPTAKRWLHRSREFEKSCAELLALFPDPITDPEAAREAAASNDSEPLRDDKSVQDDDRAP